MKWIKKRKFIKIRKIIINKSTMMRKGIIKKIKIMIIKKNKIMIQIRSSMTKMNNIMKKNTMMKNKIKISTMNKIKMKIRKKSQVSYRGSMINIFSSFSDFVDQNREEPVHGVLGCREQQGCLWSTLQEAGDTPES